MFLEKDGSFKTPLGLATTAEGKVGRYLLVHLLTGQHVCFSYFAFFFSPLPVLITLSNILSWTVCLPELSDQLKSEKDRPKT